MISRLFRVVIHDSLLAGLVGVVIGVLAESRAILILIGLGIVLRFGALVATDIRQDRRKKQRADYFRGLRDPDSEALSFATEHGHKEVVVGKVIEIWVHPSLESMLPVHDLGMDPRLVTFSGPSPKDFGFALARCGGKRSFPPPNQRKYGIAKLPLGTMDDEDFDVSFFETDWDTWMSVRTRIEKDAKLRHELSHILPEQSKVPQSMSLQFIVRFANGDVLAMKRKEGLASDPGSWAFSAEEQLHEHDFRKPEVGVAEYLFRRAFVEEVFGRRGLEQSLLNRIWTDDCAPIVRSHRIWGFFLEEHVAIFQTFGIFQLTIGPDDLLGIHKTAISAGWGTTDPEGYWYVVSQDGIHDLLTSGTCVARRLHGESEVRPIKAEGLHATSRYRLWRLHCALNRTPEPLTRLRLR